VKIKTDTTVTITMSGHKADELAEWMHANNAMGDNPNSQATSFYSPVANNLLSRLRDLPPTGEVDA
jgi:hypothetical protein